MTFVTTSFRNKLRIYKIHVNILVTGKIILPKLVKHFVMKLLAVSLFSEWTNANRWNCSFLFNLATNWNGFRNGNKLA